MAVSSTMCNAKNNTKVSAIDLFCGAGGLTHGLERSGIHVNLGIDIDPECEYPYTENNNTAFLLKPVEQITGKEIAANFIKNSFRLLAGCAPCQTFSTYNQKACSFDKRWNLLLQFSRLIIETEPELVTMENVPGLLHQGVFREFINGLKEQQYHFEYTLVDCTEYGLPQQRTRLVLLASKLGPIKLLSPTSFQRMAKKVRDVIKNLPPIEAGEEDKKDPLHQSASLSQVNLQRIIASKPGGTWRDWPQELIADCHRKETGKTYPSVYGRMSWDEPSPTITTQFFGFGNGRFGHPIQNRAISLREGALLQSFPRGYRFTPPGEPISKKALGRMIGNAVPVLLGEVIGKSVISHVDEYMTVKASR